MSNYEHPSKNKVEYVLGKNYTVPVLMLLYDFHEHNSAHEKQEKKKRVTTSTFTKISTHYQGPVKRAKELAEIGLTDIKESPNPRVKEAFELTKEGMIIAKRLKEIENNIKKIEKSPSSESQTNDEWKHNPLIKDHTDRVLIATVWLPHYCTEDIDDEYESPSTIIMPTRKKKIKTLEGPEDAYVVYVDEYVKAIKHSLKMNEKAKGIPHTPNDILNQDFLSKEVKRGIKIHSSATNFAKEVQKNLVNKLGSLSSYFNNLEGNPRNESSSLGFKVKSFETKGDNPGEEIKNMTLVEFMHNIVSSTMLKNHLKNETNVDIDNIEFYSEPEALMSNNRANLYYQIKTPYPELRYDYTGVPDDLDLPENKIIKEGYLIRKDMPKNQ